VLEATWREAIEQARDTGKRGVAGGRSMGGRIASQVVAQGAAVDGLVLFAYPLHPPGRAAQARTEHLSRIGAPTLFCSGTRDAYGSPEELDAAVALVPGARLHLLEGADHGFNVLKSSGRTRQDVWAEATQALIEFVHVL
jgi:predicted alpha/beta-hydrolase family hydrolase